MRTLNLGIIGLGNQGKLLLQSCPHIKGINIIAVADTSERSLKFAKNFGIKEVFKNYEGLLNHKRIDAVIIGLPNFLHYECAVKAAEAKKDILLEKPLARTVEEGKEIVSSVEKNGRRWRRFAPCQQRRRRGAHPLFRQTLCNSNSPSTFSDRNDQFSRRSLCLQQSLCRARWLIHRSQTLARQH